MEQTSNQMNVYLETGEKRTFAGAVDWPGWCRSGTSEQTALQALLDYAPRYARILNTAKLEFHTPAQMSQLSVIERLKGNSTTDFGAPCIAPASDEAPVSEAELLRLQQLLEACWQAFAAAVQLAAGKELRKGPRGGGREVDDIIRHVLDANGGYLSQVGWKFKKEDQANLGQQIEQTRQAVRDALVASAHGEIAARGPRGGRRWTPRYFVRRVTWHILDHAWEIEDRRLV